MLYIFYVLIHMKKCATLNDTAANKTMKLNCKFK